MSNIMIESNPEIIKEPPKAEHYLEEYDVNIGLITDSVEADKAARLEQKIWEENDFGSLEEYDIYNTQSRIFGAFKDGECVGITRMFSGSPELPPFTHLPTYDDSHTEAITDYCERGIMEELGTTAVDHEASGVPKGVISLHMWRLAYRDAMDRGIKYWGIIMEPERVQAMNDNFNFTFLQLGPAVEYQGGDCAAFVMDLEEVDMQMSQNMPDLYDWFVNEPLTQGAG